MKYRIAKNSIALFIVFLVTINFSLAQEKLFLVKGKVVSNEWNSPLEEVFVSIIDLNDHTIETTVSTDQNGHFEITFKKGNYHLSISSDVYESWRAPVNYDEFKDGIKEYPEIRLSLKEVNKLVEIVLVAKGYAVKKSDGKKIFLVKKELADLAGSMSNLLSYIPAVFVGVEGEIRIRGNKPKIMIDGRKSNLTKEDALQLLPSDIVHKIEVITNPSVSDGGSRPIINIITKKNKKKGLNGGVNLAIGLPLVSKGGLHLSQNSEKFNIYGIYGVNSKNKIKGAREEFLEKITNGSSSIEKENNEIEKSELSHLGEIGFEYRSSKKVEFAGNTSIYTEASDAENRGTRIVEGDVVDNIKNSQFQDDDSNELSFEQALEFKKEFTKKRNYLELEFQYEYEKKKDKDGFLEETFDKTPLARSSSSKKQYESDIELKMVYSQPISKDSYLKLGYEFNNSVLSQKQNFENDDIAQGVLRSQENDIEFTQILNSGFVEYRQILNDFDFRLGLRLDGTKRTLTDKIKDDKVNTSFNNILPNVNINYEIGNDEELSFGYNKGFRLPKLRYLNSFNTSLDLQNIRIGNPDLNPETRHNMELEYLKEFKKSTFISTFFVTLDEGIIQKVTSKDGDITITTPKNVGNGKKYGLELFYGLNTPSWLRTNINIRGAYNMIRSEEEGNSNNFFTLNSSISNIIKINSSNLEISWFYKSPSQSTFQHYEHEIQYFKFGMSQRVFKGKGNLVFSVIDPFNSRRKIETIRDTDFNYRRDYLPQQRQFFFSLFFRFDSKGKFRKTERETDEKEIFD